MNECPFRKIRNSTEEKKKQQKSLLFRAYLDLYYYIFFLNDFVYSIFYIHNMFIVCINNNYNYIIIISIYRYL